MIHIYYHFTITSSGTDVVLGLFVFGMNVLGMKIIYSIFSTPHPHTKRPYLLLENFNLPDISIQFTSTYYTFYSAVVLAERLFVW